MKNRHLKHEYIALYLHPFALSKLYGLTQEQKWLDMAEIAVNHFIEENYEQYKDHWIAYSKKKSKSNSFSYSTEIFRSFILSYVSNVAIKDLEFVLMIFNIILMVIICITKTTKNYCPTA